MALPEHDTFWRIAEWIGWAVGAVASAILGWVWRRYAKDRGTLCELKRKMAEVDRIRALTNDGRLALERIDDMEQELATIRDSVIDLQARQREMESHQQTMLVSLVRIETKQGSVLEQLGRVEQRLFEALRNK